MNISQQSLETNTYQLSIQIEPDDYRKVYRKELNQYAREANIPGFRKGKVPVGMIRNMMGKDVVAKVVGDKLNTVLREYIEDKQIRLMGSPIPDEEDTFEPTGGEDETFTFNYRYAVFPELNLDFSTETPIEKAEVTIDDAFIEKHIEHLRDRFAETTYPETYEKGDIAFGRLEEIDEEGNVVEDGFSHAMAFNATRFDNPAFFESLEGKSTDEIIEGFDLKQVAPDAQSAKDQFLLSEEEYNEAISKKLQLRLARISRTQDAELGPEFYQRVFNDENVEIEDEAAFRTKIREDLQREFDQAAEMSRRNKIRKAVQENNKVELPEQFLKDWLQFEHEVSDEDLEKEYANLAEGLPWQVILVQLERDFPHVEVKGEDLANFIRQEMSGYMEAEEDVEANDARMNELIKYVMQNEQMRDNYYRRLQSDRIFGLLEDKVEFEEKSYTATEYEAKIEAENAALQEEQPEPEETTAAQLNPGGEDKDA